jgi:hypothetical protein
MAQTGIARVWFSAPGGGPCPKRGELRLQNGDSLPPGLAAEVEESWLVVFRLQMGQFLLNAVYFLGLPFGVSFGFIGLVHLAALSRLPSSSLITLVVTLILLGNFMRP